MKIMTVLGTRPEIIRLSMIIKKLDKYCEHILVHTGQNYDENLNDIFFKELELREPNYCLGIKANSFTEQIGKILIETEKIIIKEKPDALLILGDTNSGLVSIVAKRMKVPVYHMEAGNRCYNNLSPEEVNRKVIDHSSDILMPYTQISKDNLLREGIHNKSIYVIGNPIYEVLQAFEDKIDSSNIHDKLDIEKKKYFLITMHREENVDNKQRLKNIIEALDFLQKKYKCPVICSLHPRTKDKLEKFGVQVKNKKIKMLKPLGFFDFVCLEKNAFFVLTDSGTVQEECCIFKIPNVIIRDTTERQETIECGSGVVCGLEKEDIIRGVDLVVRELIEWCVPADYCRMNVSMIVQKIILGKIM